MPGKDYELERLRSEMDAAQRDIDSAKARLDPISTRRDSIRNQIDSANYRIADIKHSIDEEYRMMKICYQSRDKYDAENHKYAAIVQGQSSARIRNKKRVLQRSGRLEEQL